MQNWISFHVYSCIKSWKYLRSLKLSHLIIHCPSRAHFEATSFLNSISYPIINCISACKSWLNLQRMIKHPPKEGHLMTETCIKVLIRWFHLYKLTLHICKYRSQKLLTDSQEKIMVRLQRTFSPCCHLQGFAGFNSCYVRFSIN